MSIEVIMPGFQTTVQDAGRAGHRASGVSPGGALDAHALRVANLVVGNEEGAAGLEIALGNLLIEFADERVVAWCGGVFEATAGGAEFPAGRPRLVRPGEQVAFRAARLGCRSWLAISGGVDVPPIMGSRSTDLRAGFGGLHGRALRGGDRIPLGEPAALSARLARELHTEERPGWSAPAEWSLPAARHPLLRFVRGTHWTLLDENARAALVSEPFTVTPSSDRMGVRFTGPRLDCAGADDLVSEAVAAGTVQVPPSGEPILLLPDCQTIGGYPKIAHVITVDLPQAAQLRPGDAVRLREIPLRAAHELLRAREREMAIFRWGVRLRIG